VYLPNQFQRSLAPEAMTAAERRQSDEQQGLLVAALAESWRHFADRARMLARPLPLIFRKDVSQTCPQQPAASAPAVRAFPEKVAKSQPGGHTVRRRVNGHPLR
jgi:hypothetical protein